MGPLSASMLEVKRQRLGVHSVVLWFRKGRFQNVAMLIISFHPCIGPIKP